MPNNDTLHCSKASQARFYAHIVHRAGGLRRMTTSDACGFSWRVRIDKTLALQSFRTRTVVVTLLHFVP